MKAHDLFIDERINLYSNRTGLYTGYEMQGGEVVEDEYIDTDGQEIEEPKADDRQIKLF